MDQIRTPRSHSGRSTAWIALAIAAAVVLASARPGLAAQADADSISAIIQQRHLPAGVILDPIFASPASDQIVDYTRAGDSAIWTGHYLAAEAFRYSVTQSPDALNDVRAAVNGIRSLRVVTGTDVLARSLLPVSSPYAASISTQEAANRIFNGTVDGASFIWVGHTSRDEYCGVFFGMSVAYDLVNDDGIRSEIQTEVTSLLNFLLFTDWTVIMPDFSISTSFLTRPEEQLAMLQIGRQVNPSAFAETYQEYRSRLGSLLAVPILVDCSDTNGSYFKFNLDEISFYDLIRLEDTHKFHKRYLKAYMILRDTLESHGNAHFNMIDRGLRGPDAARDAETASLLDQWLQRPRRDPFVDWTGTFAECGALACEPLPVPDRVPTDFLWQRSPFQLSGGGAGTIETAGIDYLLPYWMARYYGVVTN